MYGILKVTKKRDNQLSDTALERMKCNEVERRDRKICFFFFQ